MLESTVHRSLWRAARRATVALLFWSAAGAAPSSVPAAECGPAEGLSFVCGTGAVEEMVAVPGTSWMIAGALNIGRPAVFHLIERTTKTARPAVVAFAPRKEMMRGCPGKPDPARWSIDGLALAEANGGEHLLYAANHGDRRAVEIFSVDRRAGVPSMTWIGCAIMPPHTLPNAVAASADGFDITSFYDPEDPTAWARLARAEPVSSVWSWTRDGGFARVETGPLSGANGIARSRDGGRLYVSAWAERALVVIDTGTGRRRRIALDFLPDNIHVDTDGSLLIAGQATTVDAIARCTAECRQPWVVVRIGAEKGRVDRIISGPGTTIVDYACGAQRVGRDLWITLRGADRIAWVRTGARPH